MRVYCGKSAKKHCLTVGPFVLLIAITVSTAMDLPVRATSAQQQTAQQQTPQQKTKESKEASDRLDRDAKKALKQGKFDAALAIYLGMIETDARDNRARLGASFAYLKLQNYAPSFQQAKEVLSIDANNARAHALAGLSLLRSGFIRAAVGELQQSLDIDPKEALAYGGAAEIDYYEGRPKDARSKANYAHN
jgi:tetratricopeptide (TPR) repeat protein